MTDTTSSTAASPAEDFIPVAEAADIPPGVMKCVAVERRRVLLANVAGRFYAVSDICGHRNAPLSRGRLDRHVVECPLHFAQFDVRSGKLIDGPVSTDLPVFETRIDGTKVFVRR